MQKTKLHCLSNKNRFQKTIYTGVRIFHITTKKSKKFYIINILSYIHYYISLLTAIYLFINRDETIQNKRKKIRILMTLFEIANCLYMIFKIL